MLVKTPTWAVEGLILVKTPTWAEEGLMLVKTPTWAVEGFMLVKNNNMGCGEIHVLVKTTT